MYTILYTLKKMKSQKKNSFVVKFLYLFFVEVKFSSNPNWDCDWDLSKFKEYYSILNKQ